MKSARAITTLILAAVLSGCLPDYSTVILTEEDARKRILSNGITLPSSATDIYYAFQPQFADYLDTWISFTASSTDCISVAQALAAAKAPTPTFVSGTRSRGDAITGGPAYHHPEFASRHWNLSEVTNGTMFETKGLFILIDKDTNRIYISLREP